VWSCMLVGRSFGFGREHIRILRHLIEVDWHDAHKAVVEALETIGTSDTVEALFRATQWIPRSFKMDGERDLAIKAIQAIGKISGSEAETMLVFLARCTDTIVREKAIEQLEQRQRME
jgi:hypothetical protein